MQVENHRIVRFDGPGQAGPGIINAGCYLLGRKSLAEFGSAAFSFETDYLLRRPPGALRAWITSGLFIDIGVPADYQRAQSLLARLAGFAGYGSPA